MEVSVCYAKLRPTVFAKPVWTCGASMMDERINVSRRMTVYSRRVVMEDLTPSPPQHRPHAAGPKQQHKSSRQHIQAC